MTIPPGGCACDFINLQMTGIIVHHRRWIQPDHSIAQGAEPDTGWSDLVERADAQLYRAKAAGRGRRSGAGD